MNAYRIRKSSLAFWSAVFVLLSVLVPLGLESARANHPANSGLEVTPEVDSNPIGSQHTMTATLVSKIDGNPMVNPGPDQINIDFELESTGGNNQDGNTPTTPDLSCDIPVGQSSCTSPAYTGNSTGTDTWRVWIDHNNANGTTEADSDEGRRADTGSDEEPGFDDDGFPVPVEPGTGCSPTDNEGVPVGGSPDPPTAPTPSRSDCTDVVQKSWFNPTGAQATTLDCDDSSGPDTEFDRNPGGGDSDDLGQSEETYTCTVRNQSGGQMNGVEVKGEVENAVNDPDINDGPSYDRPDYTCTTALPFGTPPTSSTRNCQITVTRGEGELGTADICFWVGTATAGQTLCASEDTYESAQLPAGSDNPNDLADAVEKEWVNEDEATQLNCEPDNDSNPVGTAHTITCTAESHLEDDLGNFNRIGGTRIDAEATGANDPDGNASLTDPDFSCTTAAEDDPTTPAENEQGTCSFTHGPGGKGTTGDTGTTLYRAWVDKDNSDATAEADTTEGRDEATQPGNRREVDETDVMEKRWVPEPTSVTVTPESDSAPVGTCNPYTVTARNTNGQPVEGAIIDVEQRHQRANDATANNEPDVGFCTPTTGPNPSGVNETAGDLEEEPDNKGTAGGETDKGTNAQGQVTFGINVQPSNGSDGTGNVDITAWFDTNDNDDPDTATPNEPRDTATKTWTPGSEGRTIDCTPASATNAANTDHQITCTVRNSASQPAAGEGVTFTSQGVGGVDPTQATTDASGQVTTTATSAQTGEQTVTATLTDDTGEGEPDQIDDCDRAAGDPSGAPAGNCSDSVTKTWTAPTTAPATREVALEASKNKKTYGFQFTLTASVDSSDPNAPQSCIQGVTVEFQRTVTGSSNSKTVDTATTGSDGVASISMAADKSAIYVASVEETSECASANSSGEPVNVKKKVGFRISDQKVRKGQRVRLRVKVKPCGPPDGPGHQRDRVVLYKRVRGTFAKVDSARTNKNCVAVFRKRIRKDSVFQARSPKQDADHLGGRSRKKAVQVR